MSEHSKIEWTDHTFNPWSGCVKVSPACKNCYAAALPPAYRRNAVWGAHTDRMPASDSYWAQPLAWDRKARKEGVRRRVFCASTADVFEDRADLDPLRERLWDLIQKTPNLDWLLLTKRPEVMFNWSQSHPWPSNAWAGTTVESQEWAGRRIPWLLKVPAQIRFVSCEPLLGEIKLDHMDVEKHPASVGLAGRMSAYWINCLTGQNTDMGRPCPDVPRLSWVIAGGESGPNARPSHPDWFRSLRDQCREAGVPFLFKQNGEWISRSQPQSVGHLSIGTDGWGVLTVKGEFLPQTTTWNGRDETEEGSNRDAPMKRIGKVNAGRLLDGIEHNEFPNTKES